jgi:hypothetical protein
VPGAPATGGQPAARLRIPPILADALLFAYLGSMIGLAQWILLRKKYAAAGWWIPANALGF